MPAPGKNAKIPSKKVPGGPGKKTGTKTPQKPKGKPFEKGCAPGPGRPKGSGISRASFYAGLRDYLEATGGNGKNRLNQFIEKFFDDALKGKGWQSMMLAERLLERDFLDKITTQLDNSRREDEDFLAYRCFKTLFGQSLLSAMSSSRRIMDMAGRRAGKTRKNVRKIAAKMAGKGKQAIIVGLTFATAMKYYWDDLIGMFDELGLEREIENRTEGHVKLENGSECYLVGNSNRDEREKIRGGHWDIAVIDEGQSQKELPYLVDEIISPGLIDTKGQLVISGTGPRIRGTYYEHLWTSGTGIDRYNWNLTDNPYIADGEAELAQIRKDKGLLETSPLYVREYLGQIAYDDDALVYRLGSANYYTDADLAAWKARIPPSDLHCSIGLDVGWTDADGLGVILYADGKPEKWLVYEYKARRENTEALAVACRAAIACAEMHTGRKGEVALYVDSAAAKTIGDLQTIYGLPATGAYKMEKRMAVENLQEDVRTGRLKVKEGGIFADEALKTVFKRDESDNLTREIDDDTYHPDLLDAVLYADRPISIYARKA